MALIEWKEAIIIGKFIYGVSAGLISVTWQRYMEEVLPPNLVSQYGGIYCMSISIA